jgi:DNA-binding NtrC family response regulator
VKPRTVLIVDDDTALRDSLADILWDEGYEPVTAGSCADALQIARQKRPGAAFSDLKLTRQILKLKPGIPVKICSGFSEMMNKKKAKAMGIRKFVMKPLEMRELAETIRRILDENRETSTP